MPRVNGRLARLGLSEPLVCAGAAARIAIAQPSGARLGVNWFPGKNQVLRWNFEVAKLERSPVGALSLPYSVGATGYVFRTNFMLWL